MQIILLVATVLTTFVVYGAQVHQRFIIPYEWSPSEIFKSFKAHQHSSGHMVPNRKAIPGVKNVKATTGPEPSYLLELRGIATKLGQQISSVLKPGESPLTVDQFMENCTQVNMCADLVRQISQTDVSSDMIQFICEFVCKTAYAQYQAEVGHV